MNPVIESQAQIIAQLIDENDNMSCYLFLENQHIPLHQQDEIISAVNKLSRPNAGNIAKAIDNIY